MFDPPAFAAACGLRIEVIDLGDWDGARLISEYDARARTVRVNIRALEAFCGRYTADTAGLAGLCNFAIAHELYHHYEAVGVVPRQRGHARREAAANAFAQAHVPIDERVAAFLSGDLAPPVRA